MPEAPEAKVKRCLPAVAMTQRTLLGHVLFLHGDPDIPATVEDHDRDHRQRANILDKEHIHSNVIPNRRV